MPTSATWTRRPRIARLRLRQSRLGSDLGDRGLQDQPRRARRPAASARPINIMTARPLRQPGPARQHRREGRERHLGRQPARATCKGDSVTPEISGIYSNTFARRQVRRRRSRPATRNATSATTRRRSATAGARSRGDEEQLGHDSAAGHAGLGEHHQPSRCRPTLLGAAEPGLQRQRHRAQAHQRPARRCSWRRSRRSPRRWTTPTPRTRCRPQRNELSVWFNFGPSSSSWTDGPVAGPLVYSETDQSGTPATCDGRRQVRHQEREQVAGLQPRRGSVTTASASSSTPTTRAPNPAPTARTAPTPCSAPPASSAAPPRPTSAQDFPVMSVELPRRTDWHRPVADDGHRLGFRNSYMKIGNRAGAARAATSTSATARAWTSAWR